MNQSLLPSQDNSSCCYLVRTVDPTTTMTTMCHNNENMNYELSTTRTTITIQKHHPVQQEQSDRIRNNHNNIDIFHSNSSSNLISRSSQELRKQQKHDSYNRIRCNKINQSSLSLFVFYGMLLLLVFSDTTRFVKLVNASVSYSFAIEEPGEMECFFIRVPKDRETILSGDFDAWSEHEHMHVIAWIEHEHYDDLVEGLGSDSNKNPDGTNKGFVDTAAKVLNQLENNIIWQSQPTTQFSKFEVKVHKGGRYALCFENVIQTPEVRNKHKQQLLDMEEKIKNVDGNEQLEQLSEYNSNNNLDTANAILEVTDDVNEEHYEEEVVVGFSIHVSSASIPRTLANDELGPDAKRAITLMDSLSSIERNWGYLKDHFEFLRNREALHNQLTTQINTRVISWSIIEAVLVISMSIGQVLYWRKFFEQRRYL